MTTPKCPYFGSCGGCSLQHIDYSVQLENKKKALSIALSSSSLNPDEIKIFSGREYGYRNRMDFVFHNSGLGFRKKGDWKTIVDVKNCAIANEKINSILAEIRENFKNPDYFDIKRCSGTIFFAVIRAPQNESSVSFVLNEDSKNLGNAVEDVKKYAEKSSAMNVLVTYVPHNTNQSTSSEYFVVKGTDMLEESYLGRRFLYSAQGFFQNNTEMAEKMQEYVNCILRSYDTKNASLLDLYGGVGTFGIINAEIFKKVMIVEADNNCIEAAKKNIGLNGVKNAEAMLMDAKYLKKIGLKGDLYVINDPPRSGMNPKTIETLKALKPKVIIYVSCNIEQLSKDLPKFKEYCVKSAALFDLFPQTNHCEAVVELVLKN